MMGSWGFFLAIAALSFGAGAFGALLGLGGGVIIVPALTLLLGVDIRYAIGASIVAVIATSCGAAATYVRDHISNIRIGMFLQIGTALGAITGAFIAGIVSGQALYVIFAVVLAYCGFAMLRKGDEAPSTPRGDAVAERLQLKGSYHDLASGEVVQYSAANSLPVLGISYLAGTVSGLLGIGGGPVIVPMMDIAMHLPLKVSSATSSFMIGVTAAASAAVYFMRGQINPAIAAPVALGVIGGSVAGTRLMVRAKARALRYVFVGLLVVLAVQMAIKGIG